MLLLLTMMLQPSAQGVLSYGKKKKLNLKHFKSKPRKIGSTQLSKLRKSLQMCMQRACQLRRRWMQKLVSLSQAKQVLMKKLQQRKYKKQTMRDAEPWKLEEQL